MCLSLAIFKGPGDSLQESIDFLASNSSVLLVVLSNKCTGAEHQAARGAALLDQGGNGLNGAQGGVAVESKADVELVQVGESLVFGQFDQSLDGLAGGSVQQGVHHQLAAINAINIEVKNKKYCSKCI